MTEQEYIDATNLAKLRAAAAILRDVMLPDGDLDQTKLCNARNAVHLMASRLERRVKIKEQPCA